MRKILLLTVATLTISFSAQASSFCSELVQMQKDLATDLDFISEQITEVRNQEDAEVYLQRYDAVYKRYQAAKAQHLDQCLN